MSVCTEITPDPTGCDGISLPISKKCRLSPQGQLAIVANPGLEQQQHGQSSGQSAQGPWPLLTSLSFPVGLKSGLCTQPSIFSDFNGKFPLLKSLTSCEHRLDKDGVIAMTAIDWPSLTTLYIEPSNDAMPELM